MKSRLDALYLPPKSAVNSHWHWRAVLANGIAWLNSKVLYDSLYDKFAIASAALRGSSHTVVCHVATRLASTIHLSLLARVWHFVRCLLIYEVSKRIVEMYSLVDRPVLKILHGACLAMVSADSTDDKELRSLLVKHSVLHCGLTIEAFANCLVYDVKLHKKLSEKIDRMPALDKLSLGLRLRFNRDPRLDRNEYEIIKEVFSLRDSYVHQKVKKTTVKISSSTDAQKVLHKSKKHTKKLKVPLDSDSWQIKHAIAVVKKTVEFMNFFLFKECELSIDACDSVLLTTIEDGPSVHTLVLKNLDDIRDVLKEKYSIKMEFIHPTDQFN